MKLRSVPLDAQVCLVAQPPTNGCAAVDAAEQSYRGGAQVLGPGCLSDTRFTFPSPRPGDGAVDLLWLWA